MIIIDFGTFRAAARVGRVILNPPSKFQSQKRRVKDNAPYLCSITFSSKL